MKNKSHKSKKGAIQAAKKASRETKNALHQGFENVKKALNIDGRK